jgi:DNA mismatch endonuclease, patch repair protein
VTSDVHTPEQRTRNMAAIRGKDTKPEMVVRRLVHRLGYRFRLHRRDLPGTPDIVFPSRRKAIFVHGCFWHCHDCKYGSVRTKANAEFWRKKRTGNVARDVRNLSELAKQGWKILVLWECSLKDKRARVLETKIRKFLR